MGRVNRRRSERMEWKAEKTARSGKEGELLWDENLAVGNRDGLKYSLCGSRRAYNLPE